MSKHKNWNLIGLSISLGAMFVLMNATRPNVQHPFTLFIFFGLFFLFVFSLVSIVGSFLFPSHKSLMGPLVFAITATTLQVQATFLSLRPLEVVLLFAVATISSWYFLKARD